MVSRIVQITLDVHDLDAMAKFWSAALGYHVDVRDDGAVHVRPPGGDAAGPTMWLQPSAGQKVTKNRLHLDLVSADADEEVERLLALGASRADVGQTGEEAFEVLADPEGNEFCVLHWWGPRD
jgi:catechol 2,3-dioxygenase-like lactoylglutathione lyase family enzyme